MLWAAVGFAAAWFRGRRNRELGTVTLTVSLYAAVTFTYAVIAADAWRWSTMSAYAATWLPFVPILALAALWFSTPQATRSKPRAAR